MIFNLKTQSKGFVLILLLIARIWVFTPVTAQIITVKQDGTGDFTIIQDAVDASGDGDTVLVYPGIYYENIDLTGKGIVLAGTWLLNHEDSLINQTIIDGNHAESCVKSLSGSEWTSVIGLTIQNGFGTNLILIRPDFYGDGGGILIKYSLMKVVKCRILDNIARYGGGIFATNSSIELSGNTIVNNWAFRSGGGITTGATHIFFDSLQLNNIYLNYASQASDIGVKYNDIISKIWLDTCTVIDPDRYYIGRSSAYGVHIDRPPISVLHGKIDQINADLYVSVSGDNDNSGMTADDPLKTISFALLKIASDSINIKTVHVSGGIYSPELTGEHTPLQLKNFVNLVGQRMDNTIIDCENKYEGARFAFGQDYTFLKNMTLLDGNGYHTGRDGGISTGYSKKLVLDSVQFIGTTGDLDVVIYSDSDDTLVVMNSGIINCSGYTCISSGVKSYESPRYDEFKNCTFSRNHSDTSYEGRHLTLSILGSDHDAGWNKALVMNCLFSDNMDSLYDSSGGGSVAIEAYMGSHIDIINSTIANNYTVHNPSGGAIGVWPKSSISIYNSILYGNYGCQAYLGNNFDGYPDTMSIYYTLVQDGQAGIRDYGSYNQLNWGEGNLDKDPLFLDSLPYPYALGEGSPCIDAGTLNLPPDIQLPEYDLAGNPRVWGASVDMGAYEYGPWVSVPSAPNSKSQIPNSKLLNISPNPFSSGTYIRYELESAGRLNISVYSISGMKVRTLENHIASKGDSGKFYWDGSDQQGNPLPAGVYLIRMTMDGKEVETVKAARK